MDIRFEQAGSCSKENGSMQCQQQQSEKINFKLHLQHRALMEHITDLKYILGGADRKYAKALPERHLGRKNDHVLPF